jgi:hypothetical protein
MEADVNKRDLELNRMLSDITERTGARLLVIKRTGSGHRRAKIRREDGTSVDLIAPWSASDRRSDKNFRAFARRALR